MFYHLERHDDPLDGIARHEDGNPNPGGENFRDPTNPDQLFDEVGHHAHA